MCSSFSESFLLEVKIHLMFNHLPHALSIANIYMNYDVLILSVH